MATTKTSGPIESKVKTATAATFFVGLVLAVLEWVSANVSLLAGVMNPTLGGLLLLIVPPLVTFATSYLTRHTPRPDLPAKGQDVYPPN